MPLIEEMTQEPLLVVFDDVWHQSPLRFLARALPANAVRLVTTRYANVAQTLGGKMVRLDRLTPADGLALLIDRLDCQGETTYHTDLEQLVALLDGHALALDIAAALIKKKSVRAQAVRMVLENLRQGIGQGNLHALALPPSEERDENLEKSLALSYLRMDEAQQRRFRASGVFAPESSITVEAASAVWRTDSVDEAQNALLELVDLALLNEVVDTATSHISYRQHGLLRVYARALLETAGEFHNACLAHAQYYTNMAWHAETAKPKDYPLVEQHFPNLQAALAWTATSELDLFARLMDGLEQFLRLRGQFALLETYLPKAEAAAALPFFQTERDRLGEASLYRRLGEMLFAQQADLIQARTYFELALPMFVAEREPIGQANTLINLGRIRFELRILLSPLPPIPVSSPVLFNVYRYMLTYSNIYQIYPVVKQQTRIHSQWEQAETAFLPRIRSAHGPQESSHHCAY